MAEKFYLTTAIDYSNGDPHLGHAFEKIGADAIARYRRLIGQRVKFVIGMDEHGEKVGQAAEAAGVSPQDWVDDLAGRFQAMWRELAISHDDFIRTTEPRHARTVQELLRRVQANGWISEGTYAGNYCVGCESFKLDRELVDGQCAIHPTRTVQWVEEPNYFFTLSAFQQSLLTRYDEHPDFVRPPAKRNEIRNVVASGLQDLSVSRSRVPWGIPWPDDPGHTVYVWFDALINYLSATGFPDGDWDAWWPADLHVIGPDIVRFHAAIWPAMLEAAGLEPPRGVWSHGWVNTQGARFSKSAGVSITLRDAVDRHGPDALRYFLLREVPWDADGNFTWERFDSRYAAELADGWGNLLSRTVAMIVRYRDGVVPAANPASALHQLGNEILGTYRAAMDHHLLHQGAAEVWRLVDRANRYVEERQPWTQAKQGERGALDETLGTLAAALARISVLLSPFLPGKAEEAWHVLGIDQPLSEAGWSAAEQPPTGGRTVVKPAPLFPKPVSTADAP